MAAYPKIPDDYPITELPEVALGFRIQNYGIRQHWQMFTERQLMAMVTLSNAVKNVVSDVGPMRSPRAYLNLKP